jgi:hypothetical protein
MIGGCSLDITRGEVRDAGGASELRLLLREGVLCDTTDRLGQDLASEHIVFHDIGIRPSVCAFESAVLVPLFPNLQSALFTGYAGRRTG